MVKVEASVVINRPLEEVFAFVTTIENSPKWESEVVEAKQTSEGSISVGTTFNGVGEFLGRRIESTFAVTAYEPNRTYAIKTTSGPMPFEQEHALEPVEGGTKVTIVAEVNPGGIFRLAEPIFARRVQSQLDTNLSNLKNVLEAEA